jgi:hypothetical protein
VRRAGVDEGKRNIYLIVNSLSFYLRLTECSRCSADRCRFGHLRVPISFLNAVTRLHGLGALRRC